MWTDCTSSMTTQICLTHWMMASGVPEMVTARSVELGSMSPATWTWAPVDWRDQTLEGALPSGAVCTAAALPGCPRGRRGHSTPWDTPRRCPRSPPHALCTLHLEPLGQPHPAQRAAARAPRTWSRTGDTGCGSGISGGRVFFKYVEFSLSVEFEVTEKDGSQSQGLKRVAVFPGRNQAWGLPSFGEGKASGFPWESNL